VAFFCVGVCYECTNLYRHRLKPMLHVVATNARMFFTLDFVFKIRVFVAFFIRGSSIRSSPIRDNPIYPCHKKAI
jgi:hypothetical protein